MMMMMMMMMKDDDVWLGKGWLGDKKVCKNVCEDERWDAALPP